MKTVLLVEDEPLLRQAMVETLNLFGYRAVAAASAGQALMLLDGERGVMAMISDLSLPDMDGLRLSRLVMESYPAVAVIIATGHSVRPEDIPHPSIRLLPKPFHPEQLRRLLNQLETAQPAPG